MDNEAQKVLWDKNYLDYVTNFLTPSLHPGDIVIMNNLCTHKVDGVQQTIQFVGAQVLYLPPYSPDFNPVEMLWPKIKSILRECKVRTVELFLKRFFRSLYLISMAGSVRLDTCILNRNCCRRR